MRILGIVLGCLAFLLLVILFIRIRVMVTYSEKGLQTVLKIWFYKLHIPPEKEKKLVKKGEHEGEKDLEEESKKLPGGKLSDLNDLIRLGLRMLGRALRTIRIDDLDATVNIAGKDPFSTAMMYGSAAAGCGIILPVLENNFKIKKKQIRVNADFESHETTATLCARMSVAVWQIVRLGVVFLWQFMKLKQQKEPEMGKKKGMNGNGRSCTQ